MWLRDHCTHLAAQVTANAEDWPHCYSGERTFCLASLSSNPALPLNSSVLRMSPSNLPGSGFLIYRVKDNNICLTGSPWGLNDNRKGLRSGTHTRYDRAQDDALVFRKKALGFLSPIYLLYFKIKKEIVMIFNVCTNTRLPHLTCMPALFFMLQCRVAGNTPSFIHLLLANCLLWQFMHSQVSECRGVLWLKKHCF